MNTEIYLEYCESHGNKNVLSKLRNSIANDFPHTIDEYRIRNNELYEIWAKYVGNINGDDYRIFSTSGTTRKSKHYQFGPNGTDLINIMWELTRFPFGPRQIIKLNLIYNTNHGVILKGKKDIYDRTIDFGTINNNSVKSIIKELKNINGELSIITTPNVLLYMNDDVNFIDFIISNRSRLNLLTQHWEPFYKKKRLANDDVHFSDTMGDWTTGVFFRTCTKGHQHIFKTYATHGDKRINLLNLAKTEIRPVEFEDSIKEYDIIKCECGEYRLIYDFTPHLPTCIRLNNQTIYDISLIESLESQYSNLQFVQQYDTILIKHITDYMEEQDINYLTTYFNQKGFNVIFQNNAELTISNKRPVFLQPNTVI